eukprot:167167_1
MKRNKATVNSQKIHKKKAGMNIPSYNNMKQQQQQQQPQQHQPQRVSYNNNHNINNNRHHGHKHQKSPQLQKSKPSNDNNTTNNMLPLEEIKEIEEKDALKRMETIKKLVPKSV